MLGLGNVLLGDDGLGAAALARLESGYLIPEGVCLEDGERSGASVVHALTSSGCRGESIDLERALEALPPTARAVIWMFEVEGYSHEEIARAFGRSVSFSKSQLARAHARLRASLEPQGIRPSCNLI